MKPKLWSGFVTALLGVGLTAGAALAGVPDFLGNWVNVDPATPGITRVVVTADGQNVKVRVFGQCQPTDCDWGVVPGHTYSESAGSGDVRIVTAMFNPGFKRALVILRTGPGPNLRFTVLNDFTDGSGRNDYESRGELKKVAFFPGPLPMPHPMPLTPVMAPEDCIDFNPAAVTASHVGGAWKVVQGSMWMLDFGPNMAEAQHAADVIHHYGFDRQCFVKRPHAEMMYWKVGTHVPGNPVPGEDCVGNNPATTTVQNVGGAWKIVDGGHWMLDFGSDEAAANQALAVIKKYHLNRQCFIKRPNAQMTYWLSE